MLFSEIRRDVAYVSGDSVGRERCSLDLYLPKVSGPFPVLVWFHGGGLTLGDKSDAGVVAAALARQGIGLIAPNYRLSPQVTFPAYVEDAAQAVAWVMKNLPAIGTDRERVFVGGHSAGGYLSALLAMDVRYLAAVGVPMSEIAGFLLVSAQVTTHFSLREERGASKDAIVSDAASPAYFIRKDTPPLLCVMGDDDVPARLEENAYFVSALKAAGNTKVSLEVIRGRNHGSIVDPMSEPDDALACLMGDWMRGDWNSPDPIGVKR